MKTTNFPGLASRGTGKSGSGICCDGLTSILSKMGKKGTDVSTTVTKVSENGTSKLKGEIMNG